MILPFAIDVKDIPILIVGAGCVGMRKIKTLYRAGASLTVVDPVVRVPEWFTGVWEELEYNPSFLKDKVLVFACTDNPDINALICKQAYKKGILSCNVSDSRYRTLSSMGYFIHDSVMVATLAINSSVKQSIKIKERLNDCIKKFPSSEGWA
ncbi:NAD(P)-dependent oxidoreductase [Spirochaetia bacterium 38H-sp]|uniref:precorrin-2 dehydrogenase n=1 Tax=Rarispira pelagica TaxID=3141764 RepID=A0ABU9U9T4_9SPIR